MKPDREFMFLIRCYMKEHFYPNEIFHRMRKEFQLDLTDYFVFKTYEHEFRRKIRTIGVAFIVNRKTIAWAEATQKKMEEWGIFNHVVFYPMLELDLFKFRHDIE